MKRLLIILLLLPLLSVEAFAADAVNMLEEELDISAITDALPDDAREVSGELDASGEYDMTRALDRLLEKAADALTKQLREDIKSSLSILAMALVCSCVACLCPDKSMEKIMGLAVCCCTSFMLAGDVDGIIVEAGDVLLQLSDYSKAALPVVFSASAASGAAASASARYAAVCLGIDVIMSLAQRFIIPLVYTYVAVIVCCSIYDNPIMRAGARLIKWLATTLLTAMTILFSGYITMTGIVAGSTDAVAVKTAKTVISTALPVVGGIISDASSVVLSAAALIKNTAGAFGLVAVCAMCIGPFVSLSVKMLLFRLTSAATEMFPGGKLSSLLSDMGSAMSILLGMVGCTGIMLFISFMAAIKAVSIF